MTKIMQEKDANMMLKSEFMKATPELSRMLDYIKNDNQLEELSESDQQSISINRHEWLKQCMSEWRRDKSKFELSVEKDYAGKMQRCELCNTKLSKSVFHVHNIKNKIELFIGSNCCENVLNEDPALRTTLTGERYWRDKKFKNEFKEVSNLMYHLPSDDSKFEVTKDILNFEFKLRARVKSVYREYLDGRVRQRKLESLTGEVARLGKMINTHDRRMEDLAGLSRDLLYRLNIGQSKSEVSKIRKMVQENKGELDKDSASIIKDEIFLKDYINNLNMRDYQYRNKVDRFEFGGNGSISVIFIFNENYISLTYSSGDIIKIFGYPIQSIADENIISLIQKQSVISDKNSKLNLSKYGIRKLNNDGWNRYSLDYNNFVNYVNNREQNMPDKDKTKVKKSSFNSIVRGLFIFENKGSYEILLEKNLIALGKNQFISEFLNETNNKFETVKPISSKAALFAYIFNQYDAKYSK